MSAMLHGWLVGQTGQIEMPSIVEDGPFHSLLQRSRYFHRSGVFLVQGDPAHSLWVSCKVHGLSGCMGSFVSMRGFRNVVVIFCHIYVLPYWIMVSAWLQIQVWLDSLSVFRISNAQTFRLILWDDFEGMILSSVIGCDLKSTSA